MKADTLLHSNVFLKIKDAETGELLEESKGHNLVTGLGLYWLLFYSIVGDGWDGSGLRRIAAIKFNTTTNLVPSELDSTIQAGFLEKPIEYNPPGLEDARITPWSEGGVTGGFIVYFTLKADEFNGKNLNELSLWLKYEGDDPTTGSNPAETLFSRIVRAPIAKTSAIKIEGEWRVSIKNA